jgi:hypothetical protein
MMSGVGDKRCFVGDEGRGFNGRGHTHAQAHKEMPHLRLIQGYDWPETCLMICFRGGRRRGGRAD